MSDDRIVYDDSEMFLDIGTPPSLPTTTFVAVSEQPTAPATLPETGGEAGLSLIAVALVAAGITLVKVARRAS